MTLGWSDNGISTVNVGWTRSGRNTGGFPLERQLYNASLGLQGRLPIRGGNAWQRDDRRGWWMVDVGSMG